MSAHCHCPDHEQDPYIEEEKITHGVPDSEAPHIAKRRMCANCTGLIKVIA